MRARARVCVCVYVFVCVCVAMSGLRGVAGSGRREASRCCPAPGALMGAGGIATQARWREVRSRPPERSAEIEARKSTESVGSRGETVSTRCPAPASCACRAVAGTTSGGRRALGWRWWL